VTLAEDSAVEYPVAFVNSEKITKSRVERRIAQLAGLNPGQAISAPSFDQALELEIERALIIQAAEKEFDADLRERIRTRAGELAARRADPKTFKSRPTEADIDAYYKDVLLQTYLRKKISVTSTVTPAQMKAYYEANSESFSSGATVAIREILIRQEGRSAGDTKALIDRAAARLAAGEDFETVAKEMTQSPYKSSGGLWPPQGRGGLIAEVEKVAFSMKKAEVSAPFQSPLGWHMIRVEQADPGRVQPFSEVQRQIQERLTAVQWRNAEVRLVNELKAKAVIRKVAS